jgi:hypothetical protein
MTSCRRCGDRSPKTYCDHCTGKVYELNESWRETVHELTEEICTKARSAFQGLAERETAPVALEVLAEALHEIELAGYSGYNRQLKSIWEDLVRADSREFPTEEEMREAGGDRKYHALKEEGLLGR